MKTLVAGAFLLVMLAVVGLLGNDAVERDREYRRLIREGDDALSRGQPFVAIEHFSGAVALKRGSMLAYLKRGEAHQRRGDSVEMLTAALRDLRTAAQLDPGATRALEEIGDVNFRLRRYANAVESYQAYLRLDDHSPTVFYKLALASRADGRLGAAIAALERAIALKPAFAEAHYALGLYLRDRGRPEEARAAFDRTIRMSPAFIPAREELADLFRSKGELRREIEQLEAIAAIDPARPERIIAVALAHLRGGNRELAVTTLGRAADRFPDHPGIYSALGAVWLETAHARGDATDLKKALEALEPVAALPSASNEVLGLYGRALAMAGQHEKAEQILRQATERLPADPALLPRYAALAQRLGHLDAAQDALIRYSVFVDSDRPQTASRLVGVAEAQARAGQTASAGTAVARALELDPANTSARNLADRLRRP